MLVVILAFVFSLLLALALVPGLAKFARQIGLVDHPDNKRKLHNESIPMVGGIALFISVVVTASLALYIGITFKDIFIPKGNAALQAALQAVRMPVDFERRVINLDPNYQGLLGLVVGSSILLVVGFLDDRFGLRGRQKLIGQFIATTALILFGYHFDSVTLGNKIAIDLGLFSILFVYAWVIAAINSVNLLDGADGIAASIGIVMSLALALMAIFNGQMVAAIIAVSVAGALLGFLRFNFPPAKVYLGDTGSMLIGFVLGALAIHCGYKENYAYAFFAPIALLAIPFIDTAAAIIRRRLTGRSIFAVDRGHLHHSLMKRGYSAKTSLLWVLLLCTTTAAGSVLSLVNRDNSYAMVSIAIVIFVMIGCKIFGVAEFQLLTRKAGSFAKSIFHITTNTPKPDVQQSSVHVQGNRDWQEDWKVVCNFADKHGIMQVTMDVNAPWMHESFHATRKRAGIPRGGNHEWSTEIPLIAGGRVFGRVEIVENADNHNSHHEIIKEALAVAAGIEMSLIKSSFGLVCNEDGSADGEDTDPPHLQPQAIRTDTEYPGNSPSTST